jgi:hypothetical protein
VGDEINLFRPQQADALGYGVFFLCHVILILAYDLPGGQSLYPGR